MLDDETLRDGLQSPSVRSPTIDEKLRILHLIDALGIDTADIGLPGAGPHVVRDVERLAREIADRRLRVAANCAARTLVADIKPIAEISQRVGIPIECCAFIGSSPLRQYAEGWTLDQLLRLTEEAITFAVRRGTAGDVRDRRHDARGSGDAAPALLDRDPRRRVARLRRRHRRPRHAGRRGRGRALRRAASSTSAAAASASTGTATAIATSRSSTRWRRSTPARRGCTAPRSASASASATRRWTCCS